MMMMTPVKLQVELLDFISEKEKANGTIDLLLNLSILGIILKYVSKINFKIANESACDDESRPVPFLNLK